MKIAWNPDDVSPHGHVMFGESGVVVLRGIEEALQPGFEEILKGIKATTPAEFITKAVESGHFIETAWGVHPAITPSGGAPVVKKGRKPKTEPEKDGEGDGEDGS